MSKQPPPAPTASAIGPCPTMIKIVGRPGTGSLPFVRDVDCTNCSRTSLMRRTICKEDKKKI